MKFPFWARPIFRTYVMLVTGSISDPAKISQMDISSNDSFVVSHLVPFFDLFLTIPGTFHI